MYIQKLRQSFESGTDKTEKLRTYRLGNHSDIDSYLLTFKQVEQRAEFVVTPTRVVIAEKEVDWLGSRIEGALNR